MDSLQKIIDLCNSSKSGKFGVEEFQSRIQTALLPDNISQDFLIKLHNLCNDLEEIIYFYPQSEHKERTIKVADNLIKATLIEQNRLKGIKD